jgi:drug/metabolite transporter (DMT)-like permease
VSFSPSPRTTLTAMLALSVASMLWATTFVVAKAALTTYHPHVLVFGRMLVATVCMLPFFYRRRGLWPLKKGALGYVLLMSFCEPCLYFLLEMAALQQTTASQAGLITAMLPLMVAVGAFLFLKEKPTPVMLIGFATAIAGACWLSLAAQTEAGSPNPLLGNFLEFLAMGCATVYILCAKHLTGRFGYSPLMLTAVQALVGFCFYLPLLGLPGVSLAAHWNLSFLAVIGYLGAFITIGAYGLYNYGISRVSAGQAAAFVNLIPVFAVFWGWLLLDERFTTVQYVAAILILTGIFLSQSRIGGS